MRAQLSAQQAAALILLAAALMLAALGYRLHLWSAMTALSRVVALGLLAGALAALLALVSLAAGGWRVGPGTTIMLLAHHPRWRYCRGAAAARQEACGKSAVQRRRHRPGEPAVA